MWTEKYRPKTLDDIVNQTEIVERLKRFVKERSMPHCLFAGTPGTGKTTAAMCLAHDLYGQDYRQNYLELNASDERGIDVIRTTVKDFARTVSMADAPFKILVLDEADNLTPDAQQALRRTMEMYTNTCRFILACNYFSRIIEPIQSRCAFFRFIPLRGEEVKARVKEICEKEGVRITPKGLEALLYVGGGDLRRVINTLQAAAASSKEVDDAIIYRISGRVSPKEVKDLLSDAIKGDFVAARAKVVRLMVDYGLSGLDIVKQVHREAMGISIDERARLELIDAVGEAEYRMLQGGSDEIQLNAMLARIALIGSRQQP
ncbi:MAG: replication factor C small subunit [Candidatus Methanomethylicia archaeon]|nr:replication factor C small subunit [Candidatus Methanomethylicia archaeon]